MPSAADYYVSGTIDLASASVDRQEFGVPLFLTSHSATANRIDYYANQLEAVADGHSTSSDVYDWIGKTQSQQLSPSSVAIGRIDGGDADLTASLVALAAVDNSGWRYLNISSRADADILLAAAWAESNEKIFIPQSDDSVILSASSGSIADTLKGLTYNRTHILHHALDAEFLDGAFTGRVAGANLDQVNGQVNMNLRVLNGVTVNTISSGEAANARAQNAGFFSRIGGNNVAQHPRMASGRWLHHQNAMDWLLIRSREDVLAKLIGIDFMGMDDAGIGIIEATLRDRAARGVANGMFSARLNPAGEETPKITAPLVADISDQDNIDGVLRGFRVEAYLRNAAQRVFFDITVQN